MAYIATVPPIRFINIGSAVGSSATDPNHGDDVLVVRAFMIYLSNFRKDLQFTKARLKSFAGSMDADLAQMIADYKEHRSQLVLPADERRNSRILPQSERYALQSFARAASTIMALNLDVQPLKNYGDSVVDVMCNLFPIRNLLTGLPVRPESYWRDLARNKIPFSQWHFQHKQQALSERIAAATRLARRTSTQVSKEDLDKLDEDNELFMLLQPYDQEMKSFHDRQTRLVIETNPSPSRDGQKTTAVITVTSYGGQVPTGAVTFLVAQQEVVRVHGRQFLLESLGQKLTLSNGKAAASIGPLARGTFIIKAIYPDSPAFFSSTAEIRHEVQ